MTTIQIVSDLHLEFRRMQFKNLIKPSAPILFLLGDICVLGTKDDWEIYKAFIKFITPQYKYVFHIPGNHEYYTSNRNITKADTVPGIDAKLKKFAKTIPNLYALNNNTVRLKIGKKNYVFIGTTLWSSVTHANRRYVQERMNDYARLHWVNEKPKNAVEKLNWKPTRKYTVDDMTKLHIKAVRYIVKELKTIKPKEVAILLTHHKGVRDKPLSDILSQAYETDLANLIIKAPLKAYAYGHTHVKYDKKINGVRVVSNPKGYPSEHTKFDETFTIHI
jgi:predicted phosphodiesterase